MTQKCLPKCLPHKLASPIGWIELQAYNCLHRHNLKNASQFGKNENEKVFSTSAVYREQKETCLVWWSISTCTGDPALLSDLSLLTIPQLSKECLEGSQVAELLSFPIQVSIQLLTSLNSVPSLCHHLWMTDLSQRSHVAPTRSTLPCFLDLSPPL